MSSVEERKRKKSLVAIAQLMELVRRRPLSSENDRWSIEAMSRHPLTSAKSAQLFLEQDEHQYRIGIVKTNKLFDFFFFFFFAQNRPTKRKRERKRKKHFRSVVRPMKIHFLADASFSLDRRRGRRSERKREREKCIDSQEPSELCCCSRIWVSGNNISLMEANFIR